MSHMFLYWEVFLSSSITGDCHPSDFCLDQTRAELGTDDTPVRSDPDTALSLKAARLPAPVSAIFQESCPA